MRDKAGNTPFAKAMAVRDDEAGRAILKREPKAAEQVCMDRLSVYREGDLGLHKGL